MKKKPPRSTHVWFRVTPEEKASMEAKAAAAERRWINSFALDGRALLNSSGNPIRARCSWLRVRLTPQEAADIQAAAAATHRTVSSYVRLALAASVRSAKVAS